MRAIKREREILQSFSILLNAQYSTVPHYHLPLTLRGRGRNLYAKKESSSAPIQALVFPFFLLFLIIVSARKVSQLSLYDFQIVWSRSSICTRLSKSSSHIQCFHSIFHREKGVVGKGKKVNFGSDFISFCLVTRRQLIRACSSRFTVAVKVVLLRKHLASQVSPPSTTSSLQLQATCVSRSRNMRWFTRKQIFLFLSNFPSSFDVISSVFARHKHQYLICKTPNTQGCTVLKIGSNTRNVWQKMIHFCTFLDTLLLLSQPRIFVLVALI